LPILAVAAAALSFVTAVHAQDYPKHPITMIVPFAAGGTSDVIARAVAEEMGKPLGRPVVVENAAGGGGGAARAPATGPARAVAEERASPLGQPIVIENVAGAGGSTALARAARAEADGYTIALRNAGTGAADYNKLSKLA